MGNTRLPSHRGRGQDGRVGPETSFGERPGDARDGTGISSAAADGAAARRDPKMRWADVDLESGWWTIPATVAKNELAHRVPLTKPVIEILQRRRDIGRENAKVVFENRRGTGSIAHRAKKAASILCRGLSFEFRAHDLRRTASTGMAEAGVHRDHIAKVLNHVEGGPAATRIYDRYAYDKEKRDALERWARRLRAIVEGKTRKIVPIAG